MVQARKLVRDGYVILTLQFQREGKQWVGVCRELGTSTYGQDVADVHEELVQLSLLHLNALEEVGERERFFREHGIVLHRADPVPTKRRVELPIEQRVSGTRGSGVPAAIFTANIAMPIASQASRAVR